MKQKQTLLLIILVGLLIAFILLLKNDFFCDLKSSTFNEVITPIATIIAAAIYFVTLLEIRKGNSFGQYNIFKSEIEKLKVRFEKNNPLKYEFTIGMSKEVIEKINTFNILNFYELYDELFCLISNTPEYKTHNYTNYEKSFSVRIFQKYFDLMFNLTFHVNYELKKVQTTIFDIENSNLDLSQKKYLYDLLITDVIKDYIFMFNSFHFNTHTIRFNDKDFNFYNTEVAFINPRNEHELTSFHRFDNFNELYNTLIQHEIIEN